MVRGINHQNIFEEAEDYYQFINTLDRMRYQYDDDGLRCGTNCTLYAYCLMSNHVHLLIRERDESIGDTIKRIAFPTAAGASTMVRWSRSFASAIQRQY